MCRLMLHCVLFIGTQELLDGILARRVNLQYKIFINLLQAFHVVVSDSGLPNVKQLPDTTSHCLTKSLCNNFSVGLRIRFELTVYSREVRSERQIINIHAFTMPHTAARSSVRMGQKIMTNKVAEFF